MTTEHLLELRAVDAGGGAEPVGPLRVTAPITAELAEWGLLHWDGGYRVEPKRTQAEHAKRVPTQPPGWQLTHAGRIVLELASRLHAAESEREVRG